MSIYIACSESHVGFGDVVSARYKLYCGTKCKLEAGTCLLLVYEDFSHICRSARAVMDYLSRAALIQGPDGKPIISHGIPVPTILPTEILIRTIAVGLNPMDNKIPTNFPSPGAIIGCDLAGIVASIGSKVAHLTRPLKVGDRVCGGVHGSNSLDHESGAFAEYVKADARLVFKIPDSMSWEEAATLGVAIKTVSLCFWQSLGLEATPERPAENPFPVLVYGGSTTMGTMAIQMLKL